MDKLLTIGGKPIDRFYKLPFEKGGRVLSQQVLEAHTAFRAGKNPYYRVNRKFIRFDHGLMTMRVQVEDEKPVQVYFKVEYDHLLVSCSVDTDASYLSRYVYRAFRAMMWNGVCNFQEYYWPSCFDGSTVKSKYLDVINDRYGFDIQLKEKFKGFFRPDDPFPDLKERIVMECEPINRMCGVTDLAEQGIGYCLANTDLKRYHSNHFPFLIPYLFSVTANLQCVKSFERFVFEVEDISGLVLSAQQHELNQICFEMKRQAPLQFRKSGDLPERVAEIDRANAANRTEIFRFWHRALPLLVAQRFKHYLFTYGLRNIERKPIKKLMELAAFSMEAPKLSFLLTDKGDYFELFLRFSIKGRVFQFGEHTQALFLVYAKQKPGLWYLLEAELDAEVVDFFGRVGFKIQVPKAYFKVYFERYVKDLALYYEMESR